ncbi:uncharacterized protein RJT20DRAFT_36929 [Scheffersomyces xylosifermentans]|uniref:uncharacterized protein n=1 Tax=Scheffersomyces xylosifermentans TaxID=1304137 RepID=UPI00315CDBF1
MGYSDPLNAVVRRILPNLVIVSCPFSVLDKINVGARMALLKFGKDIIIWSPIKYDEAIFKEAVDELVGDEKDYNIAYIVVVNVKHNIAASQYKLKYPEVQIIAAKATKLNDDVDVDIKIGWENGNGKLLKSKELIELGITRPSFTENLEVIYMCKHKNRELVLFHPASKTLFLGDTLFAVGLPGTTNGEVELEQYSEKAGIQKPFYPHSGWSFITRYLQPDSVVGRWMMNDLVQTKTEGSKNAIKTIDSLDFDRIIMCHGNVIEKNGKEDFRKVFQGILN